MRSRETSLLFTRDIRFVIVLSRAVALLLVVSSVLGLTQVGWYDETDITFAAFIGQDAVSLLLAAPLLLLSAQWARTGSPSAIVCWMGALFYLAYSYYFYVVGAKFNAFFPVYIALVSMSAYGALFLFHALDHRAFSRAFAPGLPVRAIASFLIALAIAFAALWSIVIARTLHDGVELDIVTRTVISIDGVILLPLIFFGGLWMWRGETLGFALAGLLLIKVAATFFTLVVTTGLAVRWGQPADPVQTPVFVVGLIGASFLFAKYRRSLSTPRAGN